MSVHNIDAYIRSADYFGPNRRYNHQRRPMLEQRRIIRFDHNGGDHRSGLARRDTDDGFREQDLS